MKHYDYIICGAGCAGLTLLHQILTNNILRNKQILVIDNLTEKTNDKTWCFWEQNEKTFEHLIFHQWQKLQFNTSEFSTLLNIFPYQYKQIRSIDFYNFVLQFAQKFNTVYIVNEKIKSIINKKNAVEVTTEQGTFTANYAFNSTFINLDYNNLLTTNHLLQHFKGIEIETTENVFDSNVATFMDFSISQKNGTAFMYVLPTAKNKALVEYTLFTKQVLPQQIYNNEIDCYIVNNLGINNYNIIHSEFGVIPMTDYTFKLYERNIINIGAVGGCVKSSTGFAFKNIQQQVQQIVYLLANNKKPYLRKTFTDKKFMFYDSILLEVLNKANVSAGKIFTAIFKKNKPQLVLKFLENKTNIIEDFKIMSSVSMRIFLPTALKKLLRK